jgi:hypothetical protein
VDVIDLGILLSCWQSNYRLSCIDPSIKAGGCDKSPDINIPVDGQINFVDFAIMMGCWGKNTSGTCTIK